MIQQTIHERLYWVARFAPIRCVFYVTLQKFKSQWRMNNKHKNKLSFLFLRTFRDFISLVIRINVENESWLFSFANNLRKGGIFLKKTLFPIHLVTSMSILSQYNVMEKILIFERNGNLKFEEIFFGSFESVEVFVRRLGYPIF